ncbi:MAG: alanine--tRNA ligase [Bacteroidia bacterium]|nr:alanine--tRNA ligase [Bacteroidia bacterium]MCX7651587.1 alanine--tRNA ligase [Bacteroidia bacterium]MDW8417237.1 alanine--tRNA ligase [Bacteroidia bacterium]
MWSTGQIRRAFLDFFAGKGHLIVPSAPLVNKNDPTLFFVNAGMNPFKDVFMGFKEAPAPRVADTQKCLRVSGKHNDLEEVGHDTYHHTFFEMLGNWSFGDYFKAEAIAWAWELLTQVYKLPPDRLYVTVFGGDEEWGLPKDEETYALWQQYVPAERIRFFGRKDNFWEMGDTGPCGPCTEIHIDLRTEAEDSAAPLLNSGHPLVIEIWNLVFIQYNRRSDGSLEPLPIKSVDTGMGLERLAMALQGKTSTYDTDIFLSLRQAVEKLSGYSYGTDAKKDVAVRVISDHIRALGFAIADGQSPSNVGAGYVLRRLLRRAVRYGYQFLGLSEPFLHSLIPLLAEQYADTFPELQAQADTIQNIIAGEEESFLRTLGRGMARLEGFLAHHQVQTIPGEVAFELYDTYGFPLDLTQLIARERGLSVDISGYEQALAAQKARSRRATERSFGDWLEIEEGTHSHFIGYDAYEARVRIIRMRQVEGAKGRQYHVVLDKTPFYPEGGGQVSDTGYLRRGRDRLDVIHVYKEQETIIHVLSALPENPEGEWYAAIDIARRTGTSHHHTATHLLHAALREVLGPHVRQSGSLVAPDRLRFDFSHPHKLTSEELSTIERVVNDKIAAALVRREYRDLPYQAAIAKGALAFFGEKYGERVRMIEFGGKFSRELCGGTHATNTLELRYFKILSESASAAGIRRIEAITGDSYFAWVRDRLNEIEQVRSLLKHPPQLLKSVEKLLAEKEAWETQHNAWIRLYAEMLLAHWGEKKLYIAETRLPDGVGVRELLLALQRVRPTATFVLVIPRDDSMDIGICAPDKAQNLLNHICQAIGGRGGGQQKLATGKLPPLPDAVKRLTELLQLIESPAYKD